MSEIYVSCQQCGLVDAIDFAPYIDTDLDKEIFFCTEKCFDKYYTKKEARKRKFKQILDE